MKNAFPYLTTVEYFQPSGILAQSLVTPENGWRFSNGGYAAHDGLKLEFRMEETIDGDTQMLYIPGDSLRETGACRFARIAPMANYLSVPEHPDNFLICPFENGQLTHCSGKPSVTFDLPVFGSWPSQCTMSVCGATQGNRTRGLIAEEGREEMFLRCRFATPGETVTYGIEVVFTIRDYRDEALPRRNYSLYAVSCEGSWKELAKYYRRHVMQLRHIQPIAAKARNNSDLAYSAHALTLRCRLACKKLPTPILRQTPDNQPDLTVFMTFRMVEKLLEEMHRQDLGPAEINLVGWNYGGHDGAFPQLFPVEERLGGEADLQHLLKHAEKIGFPVSLHDNYFDAYALANNYDWNDRGVDHDGHAYETGNLAGGTAYKSCPLHAMKYARNNRPAIAGLPIRGAYYVDVISVEELRRCYAPQHPLDRVQHAACRREMLQWIHDIYHVAMSEGARDWALPGLDRAYLVALEPHRKKLYFGDETRVPFEIFDREIPFFEMSYHGLLLYNVYRSGVNAFPGDAEYLRTLAFGGIPLYYYHHIYNPDWGKSDGWSRDLRFTTPQRLVQDVERLRQASDDLATLGDWQYEFMEDYDEPLPQVSVTSFSSGTRLLVNYSTAEITMPDGIKLPPHHIRVC